MTETGEIMWVAGLLEGEGWFGTSHYKTPCIVVTMTDHDVIERAARVLGNKVVKQPKRVGKQAWSVSLYGHRAVEWMRVLQPLMGERRGGGLCATCYARRYRAGWRVRATTKEATA